MVNHAELLALTLKATQSGFWRWNLADDEVTYEESWRNLMQYTPDAPLSWSCLLHEDELFTIVSTLLRFSADEIDKYRSEHRVLSGTGEWRWVRESAYICARDTDGHAVVITGITQLIDDEVILKNNHQELKGKLSQATKMESIGHLTAGIAHDFNNLLTGILGYAELATEMAEKAGERQEIRAYLSQVMTAGTRAKELVNQMLAFSRLPPSFDDETPVSLLKPILSEVVQLARSTIPATIDVNYRVLDDAVKVRIHPVNLHQILLNLIINARDAINEFGKIELSQSATSRPAVCTACGKEMQGEYVLISVHDTGQGIPSKLLGRVFEPFYTTKESGKGTGMGLSVVYGLVHALDGHITIESKPGTGTTVNIHLPSIREKQLPSEGGQVTQVQRDKPYMNGIRIMVVDDEVAISSFLAEMLGLYGAKVTAFNKPGKALSEIIRNPDKYDLLITDATMPGISGLELSRAILQLRPDMPILICTGYSHTLDEETAYKNGITGYMQKPIEIPRLLAWVEQCAHSPAVSG